MRCYSVVFTSFTDEMTLSAYYVRLVMVTQCHHSIIEFSITQEALHYTMTILGYSKLLQV